MQNLMEGNINEDYYLCEGIWYSKEKNRLIDHKNDNKELDITNIDDQIKIFEREVLEWTFHPIKTLLDEDKKNKECYKPFKNSIFVLYGIFSYLEKIERYKIGKNFKDRDKSTKILSNSFEKIFKNNTLTYSKLEIASILKKTRHSLMHLGNVGDKVLINSDYENNSAIQYIGSNKNVDKIEINPYKALIVIAQDFKAYIDILKSNEDQTSRTNFKKVFEHIYKEEIENLSKNDD